MEHRRSSILHPRAVTSRDLNLARKSEDCNDRIIVVITAKMLGRRVIVLTEAKDVVPDEGFSVRLQLWFHQDSTVGDDASVPVPFRYLS